MGIIAPTTKDREVPTNIIVTKPRPYYNTVSWNQSTALAGIVPAWEANYPPNADLARVQTLITINGVAASHTDSWKRIIANRATVSNTVYTYARRDTILASITTTNHTGAIYTGFTFCRVTASTLTASLIRIAAIRT